MKKLKHSILSLLLLMGACIVSCSNDDGQTSSTDPDEVGGESFTIPVSSLRLRDPFILVDKKTSMYYLHFNNNLKIRVYKSKDLSTWKDEGYSFIAKTDFWGQQDFWAPDVYEYEGRYYLFATFFFQNDRFCKDTGYLLITKNVQGKKRQREGMKGF